MCKQIGPTIPNIRSTIPTALNRFVAGTGMDLYHDAEGSWSMLGVILYPVIKRT